jgi:hypothetical protein
MTQLSVGTASKNETTWKDTERREILHERNGRLVQFLQHKNCERLLLTEVVQRVVQLTSCGHMISRYWRCDFAGSSSRKIRRYIFMRMKNADGQMSWYVGEFFSRTGAADRNSQSSVPTDQIVNGRSRKASAMETIRFRCDAPKSSFGVDAESANGTEHGGLSEYKV